MVTVIICFYERIRHLLCCLDSLRFCADDFDEVVISDDGSSRDIVATLQDRIPEYPFPIVHLWRPKDRFRLAETRNRGIRHARGDYLIFLDCDFLLPPDTIRIHLDAARPARFIAGGCKYMDERQTRDLFRTEVSRETIAAIDGAIPEADLHAAHRKSIWRTLLFRLRVVSPRKQTLGGHFSIHREDIERVNGYDENFVGWGGEDEDLGIRLVRSGIYCRSRIHRAKVLHMWHPPVLQEGDWRQGPNIEYFSRKGKPAFCENGLIQVSPEKRNP